MKAKHNKLINARQAEAYIPPFDKIVGNKDLLCILNRRKIHPFNADSNLLVEGDPGDGKTATIQAYLADRFENPQMFREEPITGNSEAFKSRDERREWQNTSIGRILFKQIDGATDTESVIRRKLEELIYCVDAVHRVLFVDELGELYFRGFDEALRPVLSDPEITVFATAQNFHSKRRTDTENQEEQRLTALLRRFCNRVRTQKPNNEEHLDFLCYLIEQWELNIDSEKTLSLLIERSNGSIGLSKRCLVQAVDEPDRLLTRGMVEKMDFLQFDSK